MDHICRICRNDSETVILVNIFEEPELAATEPTLAEIINECNRDECQILPNDALPQKICQACVLTAQSAFRFKRLCEESYHHFCQQLAHKEEIPFKIEPELDLVDTSYKMEPEPDSSDHFETMEIESEPESISSDDDVEDSYQLEDEIEEEIPLPVGGGPYQCPHCPHLYNLLEKFESHLFTHSGKHVCEICNRRFGYKIDLTEHKTKVHKLAVKRFDCKKCNKHFPSKSHIQKHKCKPIQGTPVKKEPTQRKPYITLSVKQKYQIINEIELGSTKKKDIAAKHGLRPGTITKILKQKDIIQEIVEMGPESANTNRFLAKYKFVKINQGVFDWSTLPENKKKYLSGYKLKRKALELAKKYGETDFKATDYWLRKWRERYQKSSSIEE